MTVVIALRCKDGAVLGADRAATSQDSSGANLAELDMQKVEVLERGSAAMVGAGNPGAGYLVRDYLKELVLNLPGAHPNETALLQAVQRAIRNKYLDNTILPNGRVLSPDWWADESRRSLGSGVFMKAIGRMDRLIPGVCFYEGAFAFGVLDERNEWFYSTGIGARYATPFLTTLRREFFVDRLPTLKEGILATYWVLMRVIETRAGGCVGGGPDIAVLDTSETRNGADQSRRCRMLAGDELEAVTLQYAELRKGIVKVFQDCFPIARPEKAPTEPPPEPPA